MHKSLLTILILLITNQVSTTLQPHDVEHSIIDKKLQAIETKYHLKVGVYAKDTNNGQVIAYHANEKFPFQSTCKFIGVSALLAKNANKDFLHKKVLIHPKDILFWYPISGKYINQKVTLQTLAEGAISYSDNTAINMIIQELGGLQAINQFAHNLGNLSFKMNNHEVNLNSNPGEKADKSTPQDMALSIQKILFTNLLNDHNKSLLLDWMRNNTTGYKRIRAGVPLGWSVADKTGSGSFGVANDIGIAWSSSCKPIILSIFTISDKLEAKPNDLVIAKITKAIFSEFEQHHHCYQTN